MLDCDLELILDKNFTSVLIAKGLAYPPTDLILLVHR